MDYMESSNKKYIFFTQYNCKLIFYIFLLVYSLYTCIVILLMSYVLIYIIFKNSWEI